MNKDKKKTKISIAIAMISIVAATLAVNLSGDTDTAKTEEAIRIIFTRENEVLSVDLPATRVNDELLISEKTLEEIFRLFSLTYIRRPEEDRPKIKMHTVRIPASEKRKIEMLSLDTKETDIDRRTPYKQAPEPIERVEPRYPEALRREGVTGTVILEVEILKTGKVGDVKIIQSLTQVLDEEAVKAIRQWKFSPAIDWQGNPVETWARIPVRFAIDN